MENKVEMYILRKIAMNFSNPVMMYSIGKDSSVMLHLAMKAFYLAKLSFLLLHVDTLWKFKDMIEFRDKRVKDLGFDFSKRIGMNINLLFMVRYF